MTRPYLFIHSSGDGHLACFYLLAIIINAAVNMDIEISVQVLVSNSFGDMPRRGTAGLHGNSECSGGAAILFSTTAAPLY